MASLISTPVADKLCPSIVNPPIVPLVDFKTPALVTLNGAELNVP